MPLALHKANVCYHEGMYVYLVSDYKYVVFSFKYINEPSRYSVSETCMLQHIPCMYMYVPCTFKHSDECMFEICHCLTRVHATIMRGAITCFFVVFKYMYSIFCMIFVCMNEDVSAHTGCLLIQPVGT